MKTLKYEMTLSELYDDQERVPQMKTHEIKVSASLSSSQEAERDAFVAKFPHAEHTRAVFTQS